MIVFPTTTAQALEAKGEYRAGATDISERRAIGVSRGPLVDLRDLTMIGGIAARGDGTLGIGAKTTISQIAKSAVVSAGYPGLAEAAGNLATPQIRAVGTLAGNLLQHTRCWYYRSPEAHCLKKGGGKCYARGGDHLYHACFDHGPCVSVHPSTLGMALLAYDGAVEIAGAPGRTVEALYGDGSDPTVDHQLEAGALVTGVVLPAPLPGERSAYVRTIARSQSEWPLVEALARLVIRDGHIAFASVAVGGVAPRPLRLRAVEDALRGMAATAAVFAKAAARSAEGTSPLPMTGYKVPMLITTIEDTITLASGRSAALERESSSTSSELPATETP